MTKPQWFRLLRVEQYVKNFFVFLPLFFSGHIANSSNFWQVCLFFLAFCATASVVYIVNDILDKEEDQHHPSKKNRPIASEEVSIAKAIVFLIGILITALCISYFLPIQCFIILLSYLSLNVFYVFFAKHHSLIDVTCIAVGFVLRAIGGGFVIAVPLSQWLVLMVFLLCMFLALGKRWDDLCIGENKLTTGVVRKSLKGYTKTFLLTAMTFLSTVNCVCYILYTMHSATMSRYASEYVYMTSIWVILGNLRYLQLAFVQEASASPTRIFLKDRGVQACVLFWILHLSFLIYS